MSLKLQVICLERDSVFILFHLPGVPLPLIGMVAYGVVAILGIQLGQKSRPLGIGEANGRLVLLGTTTSMAAASAYFLYILSTKFTGEFCPYCLASVLLSFSLFISSIKVISTTDNIGLASIAICNANDKDISFVYRVWGFKRCKKMWVYSYL